MWINLCGVVSTMKEFEEQDLNISYDGKDTFIREFILKIDPSSTISVIIGGPMPEMPVLRKNGRFFLAVHNLKNEQDSVEFNHISELKKEIENQMMISQVHTA